MIECERYPRNLNTNIKNSPGETARKIARDMYIIGHEAGLSAGETGKDSERTGFAVAEGSLKKKTHDPSCTG